MRIEIRKSTTGEPALMGYTTTDFPFHIAAIGRTNAEQKTINEALQMPTHNGVASTCFSNMTSATKTAERMKKKIETYIKQRNDES